MPEQPENRHKLIQQESEKLVKNHRMTEEARALEKEYLDLYGYPYAENPFPNTTRFVQAPVRVALPLGRPARGRPRRRQLDTAEYKVERD